MHIVIGFLIFLIGVLMIYRNVKERKYITPWAIVAVIGAWVIYLGGGR